MLKARSVGAFGLPAGLGHGDHACWWYQDRERYVRDVVSFLTEGADAGEQLWHVGDLPRERLLTDLAALRGRDEMLEDGQLVVRTVAEFFGDPQRFDPARRLHDYAAEIAAATGAGWRGARFAVDVTAVAQVVPAADLAAYELAVDALVAASPAVVLCGYDSRRTPPGRTVEAVHPVQHPPDPPLGFSLHWAGAGAGAAEGRDVLRLVGEVDVDTAEDLGAVLDCAEAVSTDPLVIDLADLAFIDAAATRVLAQHALALQVGDREMHLVDPPVAVRYCLDAFDLGPLVVRGAADA